VGDDIKRFIESYKHISMLCRGERILLTGTSDKTCLTRVPSYSQRAHLLNTCSPCLISLWSGHAFFGQSAKSEDVMFYSSYRTNKLGSYNPKSKIRLFWTQNVDNPIFLEKIKNNAKYCTLQNPTFHTIQNDHPSFGLPSVSHTCIIAC
jgi:hypothetical protein